MKRLTNQQRLLGGAAAAVIVFGGGFAVWSMTRDPEAPAEAAAEAEEEHGTGEALEMDAARIQAAGIILAPVGSGSLSAEIVAQGTVVGTPPGRGRARGPRRRRDQPGFSAPRRQRSRRPDRRAHRKPRGLFDRR